LPEGSARAERDLARECIRSQLPRLRGRPRVLAEGILGEGARIDFVAATGDGSLLVVLIGEKGRDLELVALGLAQRAWVAARLPDWLQLHPALPVRPGAEVESLLLCPDFRESARSAAASAGSGLRLGVWRWVGDGPDRAAIVDEIGVQAPESAARPPGSAGAAGDADPPFRSGLTDEDLGLTPAEIRELA
jgi:hypothetical protein